MSFYPDSKQRKIIRFSMNFNAILQKLCDSQSRKWLKKQQNCILTYFFKIFYKNMSKVKPFDHNKWLIHKSKSLAIASYMNWTHVFIFPPKIWKAVWFLDNIQKQSLPLPNNSNLLNHHFRSSRVVADWCYWDHITAFSLPNRMCNSQEGKRWRAGTSQTRNTISVRVSTE